MEKKPSNHNRLRRILITGPESTGKTELVLSLAERFGGYAVEEYARGYVERLGRPYTFSDVEHIARQQVQEYDRDYREMDWVFFDTWLIITGVWFKVVFDRIPSWIDEEISRARFDLVLLCAPDIPWIPDPVRENGGSERAALFEQYKQELDRFAMPWEPVTGKGDERIRRAEEIIQTKIQNGTI
jgi:NadR type nicotinamide-nucleotide adenylyltransferase